MRKIKEVLRLHHEIHLSERRIADICLIGKGTVQRYLERAAAAGLAWPLPEELDDAQLEKLLFPPPPPPAPAGQRPLPDFTKVHHELKSNRSVTLQLLWEEFKESAPEGINYSWFCDQYREWAGHLDVVLRQDHRAGEKMFVDHAGDRIAVTDSQTGQSRPAYLFVAVLGASNYTYAEATWTRDLADWIGSHTRTLQFFGGCTRLVVPDQWRAGVSQPCYYDPEINRTYHDWATHNGVAVVPARPRSPRDKAKVEQGVLLVQRWVGAVLRKRQFFSLAQLNEAIHPLLDKLNQKPFHKLPGSRVEWYEKLDRPALQPLPSQPYVFAQWQKVRVRLDYHVEVDGHFYSAPYQLAQQQVEIRYTATAVEILYRGKRVASHVRSTQPGNTTFPAHQPKSHQKYLEWNPTRLLEWAGTVGLYTVRFVEGLLTLKPHPEGGYRVAMGLLPLARQYGPQRLEPACMRAVCYKLYRLANIRSILATGLDQQPLPQLVPKPAPVEHDNIRGAGYYGADLCDAGSEPEEDTGSASPEEVAG
jgi:transposase